MGETEAFGAVVLAVAVVGLAAVLSSRVSAKFRIPTPAIFLLCAAAASDLWPRLGAIPIGTVERVVTVALAVILFDGGMHIGRRRLRSAAGATLWIGVVGTLATAAAIAVLAHALFGLDWRAALLLATALSPTDPAVVFSVLGGKEIAGRSGVLLEGESGANDPVGIALLVSLLVAGGSGGGMAFHVAAEFVLQMVIGAAVGLLGAAGLILLMRRVPLPSGPLYPLRVLAGALAIYGAATVLHGSGFLAVFVAGIALGDERAPYKREIQRFHSSLASLAEIVAFVLLGLTIQLRELPQHNAIAIGLGLAVLLAFVVRPVMVGLLLLPVRLSWPERLLVMWAGLKGAVPILLGAFILSAHGPDAGLLYQLIFVVVAFSVIVQGGLLPTVAHRLGVPLRSVPPEPWSLGVRLRHEPQGVGRFRVAPGAPADGARVSDLPLGEGTWVSMVVRDGGLLPPNSDTVLCAGDEVLLLVDPDEENELQPVLSRIFAQ
ncbi:sodium:proton exchanger [Planosporangium thailandense]|uniref:Sodium:proton exchanger n=1 Tax=Planosporangium thailandense TaxID=765197 RepID=A0ABX0XT37_9ACTN|nr:cation:proton antiporter [Planosporangium thailandense]NJC69052.1 sodium:proton exchanger [Planosporangium thailandense]